MLSVEITTDTQNSEFRCIYNWETHSSPRDENHVITSALQKCLRASDYFTRSDPPTSLEMETRKLKLKEKAHGSYNVDKYEYVVSWHLNAYFTFSTNMFNLFLFGYWS